MNIAESKRERTGIKLSFTMTARIEREVKGGAQVSRLGTAVIVALVLLDLGIAHCCGRR